MTIMFITIISYAVMPFIIIIITIYYYISVFMPLLCLSLLFVFVDETRGVFTFTTGVCSGGGRGDPPETLNGLPRNRPFHDYYVYYVFCISKHENFICIMIVCLIVLSLLISVLL